jgi:uncharacterized protein YndB with AHSA1/START domain
MPRTDAASRVVAAPPARVYAALVDEEAVAAWLPPEGMTARFERFDARPGGSYRLVLTSTDAATTSGKATPGSEIVWEVSAVDGGARVDITADDVPDGISAEDHAKGLASSLANLAEYVER